MYARKKRRKGKKGWFIKEQKKKMGKSVDTFYHRYICNHAIILHERNMNKIWYLFATCITNNFSMCLNVDNLIETRKTKASRNINESYNNMSRQ